MWINPSADRYQLAQIDNVAVSRKFAGLEVNDHGLFDDCAISTPYDLCLGGSQSFQSRGLGPHDSLYIHSANSPFPTLHIDREEVPTDIFKTGNSQSTLHPIQDASWSAYSGLFNPSTTFEPQTQPRLSTNSHTCKPSLAFPLSSGHGTWDESIRSLSQSGPCQSSEDLPWTQTISLNSTKTCHNESET